MTSAYWSQWDYSEIMEVEMEKLCLRDYEEEEREEIHEGCPGCNGRGCNYCLMCER